MVRVSISETYDLSTKPDSMSLIGIHTPSMELVKKSYGGLLQNAKFIKFHHCDVRLACASVLPADPLQVGVSAGKIAPQDLFNPILYKAVSNEAMSMFELRMQGLRAGYGHDSTLFQGASIDKTDQVAEDYDDFKLYYSLLSARKGWKIAHPQAGLNMSNLKPYVYDRLYSAGDGPVTVPDMATGNEPGSDLTVITDTGSSKNIGIKNIGVHSMRGRPHVMPAFPINILPKTNVTTDKAVAYWNGAVAEEAPADRDMNIYVGLIVMPPCALNRMYYRLVVRWYIDVIGIRPLNDILAFYNSVSYADVVYGSDFVLDGSTKAGMADVVSGDIEKIMEGV